MTEMELAGYLRALASDCENTDGWEDAAPTCIEAADKLEALAGRISTYERALRQIRDFDDVPSYGHLLKDIARAALAQTQSEG